MQYESDFGMSSQADGCSSTSQRSVAHVRADISTAPSHHRTVRIENFDVSGFIVFFIFSFSFSFYSFSLPIVICFILQNGRA